jgi:hypothetical protein
LGPDQRANYLLSQTIIENNKKQEINNENDDVDDDKENFRIYDKNTKINSKIYSNLDNSLSDDHESQQNENNQKT